jgi:formate hydrogenlyase subunit 3/multisubunit Na+/H+ antiporter MnhD subunit
MSAGGWREGLLAATLLIPLVLAPALYVRALRSAALALAPWAALPGLVLAAGPEFRIEIPWLLLGMHLGPDATGRIFLAFTALLWLIAGIYARSYLAADLRRHRFAAFFLATLSGNLGVILARDVAGFYLFFALMTFAAYGLIVHEGGSEARRAGRVYLILAVFGEALLFAAFLLAAGAADSLWLDTLPSAVAASPRRDWIVGLILAGFGVKVGVAVLHVWLPLAHPVAPTPASAVLSGVILKAGLLGWLRFLPLGAAALPDWGYGAMSAGLLAAFYAVGAGLVQSDSKTVLAYSSIGQMGLITVPVGLALAIPAARPPAWTAVALYAAHHALAKGALFLGVGMARTVGHDVRRLRGIMAGLFLPALALAGAPLTSGALAKQALTNAAGLLPDPWQDRLAWALSLAAVGTAVLLSRFLYLAWHEALRATPGTPGRGMAYGWGLALLGVLSLAWALFPEAAREFLGHALEPSVLWSELWPPLGGVVLALLFGLFGSRFRRYVPVIPAGDLLAPAERWASRLGQAGATLGTALSTQGPWVRGFVPPSRNARGWLATLAYRQSAPSRFTVAGVLFLLLILLFVLALIPGWTEIPD